MRFVCITTTDNNTANGVFTTHDGWSKKLAGVYTMDDASGQWKPSLNRIDVIKDYIWQTAMA